MNAIHEKGPILSPFSQQDLSSGIWKRKKDEKIFPKVLA